MGSTYDFVIIGGGTSGLVVANRLSEDPTKTVLVLEAGPDIAEDPRVRIPFLSQGLLGSEMDWNFRSEPQVWLNLFSPPLFWSHSSRRISMLTLLSMSSQI